MTLLDVPVLGKKFSWFSANGKSMSRIDRFLLSDGFVSKYGITGQWIGDRDISDHCPIWLLVSSYKWGPKPFRVINGWLDHPDFLPFVESAWKSFVVHGKKAYVLKEKFRLLKERLRKWNKEVYGYLDLNIEKTVNEINDIENMLGDDDMEVELTRRQGLNKEFWSQLYHKESLLKQKSRTRWVKEGDSNSRYFHESIKSRRRRNQLVALKDGDRWVQGVDEVKRFVKNFFENNFKENWANRPNLNGITFQSLSEEDNVSLLPPFSIDEVREVVWNSDRNKCPSPDGLNFNFLKVCWNVLKGDIMEFLAEFHKNAVLPKAITASFLALIPKKDHPQALSDYRTICLVSSLYKILSKVLAVRLKKVMAKLISEVQSAFLPNRQILDGVLVVNELIDLAKRRKDKCLFFKIRACVFQSSMSVLVNGGTTEDFIVGKGLRQGDHLSPFLFLIVIEGLTGLMRSAVNSSLFHGYKAPKAPVSVIKDLGRKTLNMLQFGGVIFGGWVGWEKEIGLALMLVAYSATEKIFGFWKEKWMGMEPFCVLFPSLYANSTQQHAMISTMGAWVNNSWSWKLDWSVPLTETEAAAAAELQLLLEQVQPCRDSEDRRRWIPNMAGFFTIQSAYVAIQNKVILSDIEPNNLIALNRLWKNNVPTKVIIFGWRLLLLRLPTKEALFRRGIINNNVERCCIFCLSENEDIDHIFFHCHVIQQQPIPTSNLVGNDVEHMADA
ncbi:hypothetical protein TSUD_06860 [Trifolium subterraneum]|uniref:Reverse transcriptase domain-containing protein n=1 Tax=Trifolium subterraneum TaxID=3900 RepID=A0A2Z6PEE7_TRISU|nr:hypothetical protein TSUD_06860 [Trifolium subterraneum]